MPDIDLDAILAQREEATGYADRFTFKFKGQQWSAVDPLLASDDWKDELDALNRDDWAVAEHYMGADAFKKFIEAGGSSGMVLVAVQQHQIQQVDFTRENRPTRRSRSSAKPRKR